MSSTGPRRRGPGRPPGHGRGRGVGHASARSNQTGALSQPTGNLLIERGQLVQRPAPRYNSPFVPSTIVGGNNHGSMNAPAGDHLSGDTSGSQVSGSRRTRSQTFAGSTTGRPTTPQCEDTSTDSSISSAQRPAPSNSHSRAGSMGPPVSQDPALSLHDQTTDQE
jgi:hypothetical protein